MNIQLKPLQRADLNERYLNWLNDPEVTKYMIGERFPVTMDHLEKYCGKMTNSPNHVIFAIWVDKVHVGNVTLNDIDWVARVANVGIMIGDKEFWRQGVGTESLRQISNYAFEKLNLRKLWAGMAFGNVGSLGAFERVGFSEEGRLDGHLYHDGSYCSEIIVGMLRRSK